MGVVYRAQDPSGRVVAIKRLHPAWIWDPGHRKRLLQEALIVNAIDHPGVVRIIDHGEADGAGPFLVMELLEGKTLKAHVEQSGGRLPWAEVVHIAGCVLDALVAAHARGIAHCDVKPSNVFLCTNGHIKLLDFGVARPPALMVDTTLSVHVAGTPACMAPEQVLTPDTVDARTDLWALAATMFWAVSGQWPRVLPEPLGSLEEAVAAPARSISSLVPDLPLDVARAIDVALERDQAARWRNAAEMRECLTSFSSGELPRESDRCDALPGQGGASAGGKSDAAR